jgi:tetratricopeptide (TPR) repeat protein
MRLGRYHDATIANQRAMEVFKNHLAKTYTHGNAPVNYFYHHNLHFLWAAAMMEGRKELSYHTARELTQATSIEMLNNEFYLPLPLTHLTMARFAEWDKVLAEPQPKVSSKYALGLWHYSRGLAYANLGELGNAKKELAGLKYYTDKKLDPFFLKQLEIGYHLLKAKLNELSGHNNQMLTELRTAIEIEDKIGYKEPPAWYFPTRQALGSALLKLGRYSEAIKIFKEDLKRNPNNGWSLYGLFISLNKMGRAIEAAEIEKQFKEAWKYSDIEKPLLF